MLQCKNAVNGLKIHPDILIVDGNDNIDLITLKLYILKKAIPYPKVLPPRLFWQKSQRGTDISLSYQRLS